MWLALESNSSTQVDCSFVVDGYFFSLRLIATSFRPLQFFNGKWEGKKNLPEKELSL